MAEVFADVWRRARLHFPSVPALLVRDWAQDAFTRACESRGGTWGFLRTEGSINTLAARDLTVTFTQGVASATSAAGFVATDAGRQIRVGSYPVYTIASVTNASLVVLDQPYASTSGAETATILNAYFTTPSDFKSFLVIVDPYNRRTIPFGGSVQAYGGFDAGRSASDSGPRGLIAQGVSTATATLGQPRYEFWPYPTSERHLPYLYYKQAIRFADETSLPGVFASRADLLKLGAQLQAAEWPGTAEQKNPYYNLTLAQRLEDKWELELQRVSLADDNQFPEDLMVDHFAARYGIMASDTHLLRSTDASLADYY